MAKRKEPEKPVEPEAESGEEEEDEESSEEEPEQTQVAKKPSSSMMATRSQSSKPQQPPSSSGEEESESESESDSDGADKNLKPIASKPRDDPLKSNSGAGKTRSKPSALELVTPAKSTAEKRPAEEKEADPKDAKKSKRKKPEVENSEKKTNDGKLLFQRVWSEDDEIVVLKGMIEYASKKKSDPVADLNAFHDFIKKNLHVDVTRVQLQDKIRRLKKKYENNKSKEKEGKERLFSKPHEHKIYELSKEIWGNENGKENEGEKVVGTRGTARKRPNVVENEEVVAGDGLKLLPAKRQNYAEGRIFTIGEELFGEEKGVEGVKEWKKLKVEEMEVYLRQLEVKIAQTKLVLNGLKSADH